MIVKKRRILKGGEDDFEITVCDETKEGLGIVAGCWYIPKDDMKKPKGEDAYFISKEMQTIGVADGVGGWARKGVDAGIYARELMTKSVVALQLEPKGAINPKRVLLEAHSKTTSKGSSTACIITLKGHTLFFANVGDSGFMVFRDNRLVYQSPTQQQYFNCPYQLGNGLKSDCPPLVYEGEVQVEDGDIVVAGTDGLLDNLYPYEIAEILQETQGKPYPEQIAWTIAETALANSKDEEYDSPFEIAANLAGVDHIGGKYDDITVIVAHIETLH